MSGEDEVDSCFTLDVSARHSPPKRPQIPTLSLAGKPHRGPLVIHVALLKTS